MRPPVLASPSRACSFVARVTARKPGEPVQSDAPMKLDFEKSTSGDPQSVIVVPEIPESRGRPPSVGSCRSKVE